MARRQLELSNEVAAELAGLAGRDPQGAGGAPQRARSSCAATSSRSTATPRPCSPPPPSCASCPTLVDRGHEIGPATIESVTRVLDQAESPEPGARGRRLAPPQPQGRARSRSTRSATSTRSAAPRSPSASARPAPARRSWPWPWPTAALSRREVNRIILTRPAVEAGERLGFLPGDLMAKVDPYLRPLFDALHDMIDPERVAAHLERGVIEVAPLAFMRGRAQPVDQPVLTPDGLPRRSATLRVGDLVVGSDGRPTPVLGVVPAGPQARSSASTAQDGASTLLLRRAPVVRSRRPTTAGTASRAASLETREMIGGSGVHHQHRFELPLVSAPVEFEPREVPLDPYALGCCSATGASPTTTTPSFTTADPELAEALEAALPGIELRREERGRLRAATHRRRTAAASSSRTRSRWPCASSGSPGTRSTTKFVPGRVPAERVGASGSPCSRGCSTATAAGHARRGRTCRIQYTTCSAALARRRGLPRPLARRRRLLRGPAAAGGRKPGRARGSRQCHHRSDALRPRHPAARRRRAVPALRASGDAYDRATAAGGRCASSTSIEPAGEAETRLHPGRRRGLALRHRRLPRHAQHAQRLLRDPRRGAEHLAGADEDVPHAARVRLEDGRHRRRHADRPARASSSRGSSWSATSCDGVDGVEFVRFGGEDVVRHKLVQRIVAAYDEHAARQAPELRPAPADRRRPA